MHCFFSFYSYNWKLWIVSSAWSTSFYPKLSTLMFRVFDFCLLSWILKTEIVMLVVSFNIQYTNNFTLYYGISQFRYICTGWVSKLSRLYYYCKKKLQWKLCTCSASSENWVISNSHLNLKEHFADFFTVYKIELTIKDEGPLTSESMLSMSTFIPMLLSIMLHPWDENICSF